MSAAQHKPTPPLRVAYPQESASSLMALPLHASVMDAARTMAGLRRTAFVITNKDGSVAGILSEQDIVRRLVAQGKDAHDTWCGDVMTPNPITLRSTGRPVDDDAAALGLMAKGNFRHVPIVDERGGFVRAVDVMAAASASLKRKPALADAMGRTAKKLMRAVVMGPTTGGGGMLRQSMRRGSVTPSKTPMQQVITESREMELGAGISVEAAAGIMAEKRLNAILVHSRYGANGIVTESDIVRRVVAEGLNASTTTLADIMTPNPTSVDVGADPREALKMMLKCGYRHLPVRSAQGEFIGILDMLSVMRAALGFSQVDVNSNSKNKGGAEVGGQSKPEGKRGEVIKEENDKCAVEASNHESQAKAISLELRLDVAAQKPASTTATTTPRPGPPALPPRVPKFSKAKEPACNPPPPRTPAPLTPSSELDDERAAAMSMLARGDLPGALAHLDRALAIALQSESQSHIAVFLRTRRATVRSAVGNTLGALEDFESALGEEAEGGSAHVNVEATQNEARLGASEVLTELGRFERAAAMALAVTNAEQREQAVEWLVSERTRIKDLGRELFTKKQFDDAIKSFTSALRIHCALCLGASRDLAILYTNRAACYQETGHLEMAIEDCQKALEADVTYEKAWVRRLQCLEAAGNHLERMRVAELALRHVPSRDVRLERHLVSAREKCQRYDGVAEVRGGAVEEGVDYNREDRESGGEKEDEDEASGAGNSFVPDDDFAQLTEEQECEARAQAELDQIRDIGLLFAGKATIPSKDAFELDAALGVCGESENVHPNENNEPGDLGKIRNLGMLFASGASIH